LTSLASPESGYRLSPQQARLWGLLAQAPSAPRAGCVLLLRGELDRERLQSALSDLVTRHEILRTVHRALASGSMGVQVPQAGFVPQLELVPLQALPGTADERLAAAIEQMRAARSPLSADTALRCTLTELEAGHHALTLDVPALSLDGRSLIALGGWLAEAWERRGGEVLQFADVAELFNELLEGQESEVGRRQWRSIDPSPLVEEGRGPEAFCVRSRPVPLPRDFGGVLRRAAERSGVEPWVLVLGAWQALQCRMGAGPEWSIAVGLPGRTFEGLGDALGLFERRVPLDLVVETSRGLGALAGALEGHLRHAAEWQDYYVLDPSRRFRLAFTALEVPAPSQTAGLTVEVAAVEPLVDVFELELVLVWRAGSLELQLRADTSRYDLAAHARLAERLATLLTAAISDLEAPIGSLPVVGEVETAWLAGLSGGTERSWPVDHGIPELFAAQVRRTPDRRAVVFGDQHLTYAELATASEALAHRLCALGLPSEARVGLLLERGVSQLVGVLGVLQAGAAYVPLDPMLPRVRLDSMLEQGQVQVVVTQGSLRTLVPEAPGRWCLTLEEVEPASVPPVPLPGVSPNQLAYVLFTSGSTGRPKGVMIAHRSVVNLAAALREAVYARYESERAEGLQVSMSAPLAFDASVKQWVQLLSGHTVHIVPEEARPDPARLAEWVRRSRIDVLDCTPSQLAGLLAHGVGLQPGSPAAVLIGGEAIDEGTWRTLAGAQSCQFVNVYGPTECTVDATCFPVCDSPTPTLGRSLGNVRVRVLDATLAPAPVGVAGELYISGEGVGRGYCGSPALTAERFVPDPVGPPGSRMYRTGDRGRVRENGWIDFLGRGDGQVKLRGVRIELGEIEATLKAQEPVLDAAVLVAGAEPGREHLVGCVVLRTPRDPAAVLAELRTSLRRSLPEYMVPARLFVRDVLPLTPNGKLDRRVLLQDAERAGAEVEVSEPPASETERKVAAIWEELLGVPRVGREQNFFDLGGHSLLAVKLHDRLGAAFSRRLSLVDVFRHATVASLAAHLSSPREPDAPADLDGRATQQRQARERQAQRNRATRGPR
jgi:amino acid adenylation domain-containing protein